MASLSEERGGLSPVGISACLLGAPVRYDGRGAAVEHPALALWRKQGRLVPVCPECLGGLPTPRPAAERQGGNVVTVDGQDVTAAFREGAAVAVRQLRAAGAALVILKSRSPSCGVGQIYDGSFTGALIPGDGLFAEAAAAAGLAVFSEISLDAAAAWLAAHEAE